MAGFFDGEGSINISCRKRKTFNAEHTLRVAIGQKDGATLDWIVDNFGGNVCIVRRDGSFFWYCSNKKAYDFIKIIYPFLKYKKPQAEIALTFYSKMPLNKERKRISMEEVERRERIRNELKRLHKSFLKSQYAGSTTKRADPKGM